MRTSEPEIPEVLRTSAFLGSWNDFLLHREQMRKPMTAVTQGRLLKRLALWGPEKSVRALERSLENGWRGVFDPEGEASNDGYRTSAPARSRGADWDKLPLLDPGPAGNAPF